MFTELRFHELVAAEKEQVLKLNFGSFRVRPSLTALRYRFAHGQLVGYRWASPRERARYLTEERN